jgi:hypothetical protein
MFDLNLQTKNRVHEPVISHGLGYKISNVTSSTAESKIYEARHYIRAKQLH